MISSERERERERDPVAFPLFRLELNAEALEVLDGRSNKTILQGSFAIKNMSRFVFGLYLNCIQSLPNKGHQFLQYFIV